MSALVALALQAGFPVIEKLLTKKLGGQNGELAAQIIRSIAERAGVIPEQIELAAEERPEKIIDAMREVERMTPELVGLYAAGLQGQFALLQLESEEPLWMRAWRPGGMYLVMFLWFWNIVALHVANAIWKIALPPAPYDALGWLTGIYFSLYMGGHTVKDVIGKWVTRALLS